MEKLYIGLTIYVIGFLVSTWILKVFYASDEERWTTDTSNGYLWTNIAWPITMPIMFCADGFTRIGRWMFKPDNVKDTEF